MKKELTTFQLLRRHSAVVWSLVKGPVSLSAVLVFLTAVGDVGATWLTQRLYDAVSALTLAHTDPLLRTALLTLAVMLVFQCGMNYINAAFDVAGRDLQQVARGKLLYQLHRKAEHCGALHFEDTAFLEQLNKAQAGVEGATGMVFVLVLMGAYYLPYYLMMTVYFICLDPGLGWILPLAVLPSAASFAIRARSYQSIEEEVVLRRRRCAYFAQTLSEKRYFKETRTSGAYGFLLGKYTAALRDYDRVYQKKELAAFWRELLTKVVEAVGYLGILLLLMNAFLRGRITEGSFAAVFASIEVFLHAVNGLIQRHFGSVAGSLPAVRAYYAFMDTAADRPAVFAAPEQAVPDGAASGKVASRDAAPENAAPDRTIFGKIAPAKKVASVQEKSSAGTACAMGAPAQAGQPAIELRGVSFCYPGAARPSLRDIDLRIAKGEFVAIVGENGSGKSTLLKTLCGLYRPTTSTAVLHAAPTDLSAVFQNYQRYALTLAENIGISDTAAPWHPSRAAAALQAVSLDGPQKCFPQGLDTPLSKEFGGQELSGGQWQRLAIARGLYRDGALLFLDEPTAAIDALEEKALYEMFAQAAKGRTCVLITHRLGAARIADRILVMKAGRLLADGTHAQLLRDCPEYRRLYDAQSESYRQTDGPAGEDGVTAAEGASH